VIINRYHFESTVAEAILISPAVDETLHGDPSVSTFSISSSEIDSNDFVQFVELFRSNESYESTIPAVSLLSIFRVLGNESLSLLLLASMHSRISESESGSTSTSNSKTDPTRMPICPECLKFDVNIEYCASEFTFYSAAELGCLDRSVLHALLSSSSLCLENEDSLLTNLIELGDEYFDC
jgi:hypothetical protein